MSSPFEWLPDPGERYEVPGGFLVCTRWSTETDPRGHVEGELEFRFFVSLDAYEEAMRERKRQREQCVPRFEGQVYPRLERKEGGR